MQQEVNNLNLIRSAKANTNIKFRKIKHINNERKRKWEKQFRVNTSSSRSWVFRQKQVFNIIVAQKQEIQAT